jgi:hypothetical protein
MLIESLGETHSMFSKLCCRNFNKVKTWQFKKAKLRALAGESVALTINSQNRLYLQIKLQEKPIVGTTLLPMDFTKGRKSSSLVEISPL